MNRKPWFIASPVPFISKVLVPGGPDCVGCFFWHVVPQIVSLGWLPVWSVFLSLVAQFPSQPGSLQLLGCSRCYCFGTDGLLLFWHKCCIYTLRSFLGIWESCYHEHDEFMNQSVFALSILFFIYLVSLVMVLQVSIHDLFSQFY